MRYMTTVTIVAVVCVVAIAAWSLHMDSPEAPRLPAVIVAVTPIDTTQEVQHIVIDNLSTGLPAATYDVPVTATPGIPYCPVTVGQVCQIPPAVVLVTPTEPILCDATALPLMSPGVVCVWRIAPTFVPTPTEQEQHP